MDDLLLGIIAVSTLIIAITSVIRLKIDCCKSKISAVNCDETCTCGCQDGEPCTCDENN